MSRLLSLLPRWLPMIALVGGVLWIASILVPPSDPSPYHLADFGRLPVLANGRLKPLDTLARSSLLQLQARQEVRLADGTVLSPEAWLLDVFFWSERANTYPVLVIETSDTDLLTLLGLTPDSIKIKYPDTARQVMAVMDFLPGSRRRFAYDEIAPHLEEIDRQATLADPVDERSRTPFQRDVVELRNRLVLYHELLHTVQPPGTDDFLGELIHFQDAMPRGIAAVEAKHAGKAHDEEEAQAMLALGQRYLDLDQATHILAIPPQPGDSDLNHWQTAGQSLLESFQTGRVDASEMAYAGLGYSWHNNRPDQFNEILRLYRGESLGKSFAAKMRKTDAEVRFNQAEPFYAALLMYVFAGFAGVFSWLFWPEALRRSAHRLMIVAWVLTTAGILTRMWLEGRPPVTNLYSSALFIGWGAVGLCLILEGIFRNSIGVVAGGAIGFGTLFIAQHLALAGDTLEMMRAVLDSNMWLATHVVVVTTGYASTFLAGFLALIYILRGVLTRTLDQTSANALGRMVYGIVCFATLFSFVGTVLGGIWADQSWGRFWGWDPKENGALIIVLWNALILHARWGGFVRTRGLMCLAVFGNIVTSWSWFGTNMLGIGLHSYGFTEAAFWGLAIFVAAQLVIIALANLPLEKWRSYAAMTDPRTSKTAPVPAQPVA